MTPPVTTICQQATVRLVPTAYYKPPVLAPLADDEDELAILAEVEGLTNRRLKAQSTGLPDLDARELAFNVWGQSYINAAFAYTRAGGNRSTRPFIRATETMMHPNESWVPILLGYWSS